MSKSYRCRKCGLVKEGGLPLMDYGFGYVSPWIVQKNKKSKDKQIIRQELDEEEGGMEVESRYKIGERILLLNTVVPSKGIVRHIDAERGMYKIQTESGISYFLGERDIAKESEGIF